MVKKITNKNLFKMAQDFKDYVEAGKGIPYKFTYDGITYYTLEMTWAFLYGIFHLKSDFEIPNFKWPKKAEGDNIVEEITLEDYKKQCKNVYNYISKNKQVPNYVTTIKSKKRVNIDLFAYCMACCLVWYKNHGELPKNCKYNYKAIIPSKKSTKRKYGRSTKSGCDNRGQNNGVYCGPHMVQEIIRNLTGIVVPQSTLASVIGTTSSGSGHGGIDTAFAWFNKKYGYNLQASWKNFIDIGWSGVKEIIGSNDKDIGAHELYRDQWGHYTNFDTVYSNTIDVHNSLGSYCGSCYCGYTENRSKSTAERYMSGISQKSILIVKNN